MHAKGHVNGDTLTQDSLRRGPREISSMHVIRVCMRVTNLEGRIVRTLMTRLLNTLAVTNQQLYDYTPGRTTVQTFATFTATCPDEQAFFHFSVRIHESHQCFPAVNPILRQQLPALEAALLDACRVVRLSCLKDLFVDP
jgi:hypothetical protein